MLDTITYIQPFALALTAVACMTACGGVEDGTEGDPQADETSDEQVADALFPSSSLGAPNLTVRTRSSDTKGQLRLDCSGRMRFTVIITNIGTAVAPHSKLRFWARSPDVDVPSIAPGQSWWTYDEVTIPAGSSSWSRLLWVDASNVVTELSEIDNTGVESCGT